MPELSIVIPTCNRASLLRKAIEAIVTGTRSSVEIIVVDGASSDETPLVLARFQKSLGSRLRVIREEKREGFVKAVNKGFRIATGQHLMWLNDDARPLAGALDAALDQLSHAPPEVGLVAMFHRCDVTRNIAYETTRAGKPFRLLHVRGTLYANFGIGRRATFEEVGFFDERYFLNAADPDFSLKLWEAGYHVIPAWRSLIDHDEHDDDRRHSDTQRGQLDNEMLFEKWNLPPRNPDYNDFDPTHPATVRGLRVETQAA